MKLLTQRDDSDDKPIHGALLASIWSAMLYGKPILRNPHSRN